MPDISVLEYLRQLNFASMCLRIMLAMIAGGLLGLERERVSRAAGFRTYMIVAIGASLTVLLSQYLDLMLNTVWADTAVKIGAKTDVSRFGAQVINGVGFLGAGTIIVTGRQKVKGLTTAAGLWAAACMGLAIGAGFYECVLLAFVLMLLVMRILPIIELRLVASSRNINISVEMDDIAVLGNLINKLKSEEIYVYDIELDKEEHEHLLSVNSFLSLRLPKKQYHEEVLAMVSTVEGIILVDEV